jgi:hypothetical protein
MEDITDQLNEMDQAISATIMNTECDDAMVPVIVLSKMLCEFLVEIGINEEESVEAFRNTFINVLKKRSEQEVH